MDVADDGLSTRELITRFGLLRQRTRGGARSERIEYQSLIASSRQTVYVRKESGHLMQIYQNLAKQRVQK